MLVTHGRIEPMGVVTGSLKLNNVWRVISDVDLQAIRREANAPFDLAIIGEAVLAERLRAALSPGGAAEPHRYIRVNPMPGGPVTPTAVIVVARPGPRSADLDATLAYLANRGVPHVLAVFDEAAPLEPVISAAAVALVPVLPEGTRLAFPHQLPAFRDAIFDEIIEETARVNASFSFTSGLAETVPVLTVPMNLGDMIVLTKNQLMMGYRLVLAAGRDGEPRKLIGEILGVLGGGFMFRQLARELVGLIPVIGIVPKVAVAYGGTWAVGRAVVLWVTEGRAATGDMVKTLSREGLRRGKAVARDIVTRGRDDASKPAGRWARLRAQVPGLRRRRAAPQTPPAPPPLPPQLPPPIPPS
jgi:uncharacterized protein (DUF697 family)